jgi:membrane protein implicated in regulation of membrane protease activity
MRSIRTSRRRARAGNRTRTLFYLFITIMLAVLALSLSQQIIDSAVLMQIYIAASILAVGVIVIDMMGLLGQQHGDEGSVYDADGGAHGGDDGGDGFGDHGDGVDDGAGLDDGASFDDGGHDMAHDDDLGGDDAFGSEHDHSDEVPLHDVEHDSITAGRGPILEAIRYLRMFVYFCLGFGMVGLALLTTGRTAQQSLLFAGIAGIGTVLLARTFYRLQPSDTGDLMSDDDLLRAHGTVIVPLDHETMGKIRLQIGMQVYEPFALAASEGDAFRRGETIKVVRVTDEGVYVEKA